MSTILIIEDDKALNQGLAFDLESEGYQVCQAENIESGMQLFQKQDVDLVILDVNLPDGEGYEFCRWAKEKADVPVLFLTARDLEEDAVRGYDLGADDYVTKPFSMVLLRKKIAVILNRKQGSSLMPDYDDGFLSVRFLDMEVRKGQEKVNLTPTEYKILKVFISNRNQLLTHEMLLEKVWDKDGKFLDKHALAVNINRMRNKIEEEGHSYIVNVYGMGYQWSGERE